METRRRLAPIRRALPPGLFHRSNAKGFGYFLRDSAIYAACFLLLFGGIPWFLMPPLWILMSLAGLGLYQIGHECGHGSVFTSKRANRIIGQIAFLPCLHPMSQWVYGHNGLHHRFTSCLKRDLAWHPRSPERYKRMGMLARAAHRLYWSAAGAGPYYFVKMWMQGLILNPAPMARARRDIALTLAAGLCICAAFVAVKWTQSHSLSAAGLVFVNCFAVPFLLLNVFMGASVYLHHIHPDIPWKPESAWDSDFGQIQSTTNYLVPAWLNFFVHNLFLHVPHHVHPGIPFYNLPEAFQFLKGNHLTAARESMFADYFESTRFCKVFDPETAAWGPYPI